jgi:membrane protease YdiL (CAAX protease family)
MMAANTQDCGDHLTANDRLTRFFVVAFVGAWITWLPVVLGEDGLAVLSARVPMSLLFVGGTFTGPLLAAFVVSDPAERRELLARMFRVRMPPWVYAAALLLAPGVMAVVTLTFANEPIPASRWSLYVRHFVPFLVLGSIAGPWGEEPGWRGFALPRLVVRFGAVRASLLLGVIWAFWHLPIALFIPAFRGGVPLGAFLPAYGITVCALSFFMTWLYNGSGCSVLATIMAHAAWNAAVGVQDRLTVFPDRRLPLVLAAVLLAMIALTVSRGLRNRHSSACTGPSGAEPDGPANGSQPIRSETNSTSSAARSRR